jgi:glycosyltransferase involved in cell wall biosynthesis/CDP-glycerol glycerophosphotransferase (TagB/SpsB family)
MSRTPLISVIIPIYNVEDCLNTCIESILAQTYKNIEIILVNDGSTDSSGAICNGYAENFTNITVINKKNEGVNYARRDGFKNSKGDYITFVDADDILSPDFINTHIGLLGKTDADLSIGKTHSFYGEILSQNEIDQCKVTSTTVDYTVTSDKKAILAAFMTSLPPYKNLVLMCVWAKVYRREIVEKLNWKIANYNHGEDYFISAQVFDNVSSVCFINEYGYFYRRNRSGKITLNAKHNKAPSGKQINNFIHIKALVKMYENIANKRGLDLKKEIVICQCRLYPYWLDKLIDRNDLSIEMWNSNIKKYLFPLIPELKSEDFQKYMIKNLTYGGNLYDELRKKIDPISEYPTIDKYLQYRVNLAKSNGNLAQNYTNYKNAWVIMDRQDSATDNGYHFYKWVQKNHPTTKIFFVINRDSKDVPTLKEEGFNLVYLNTEEHKQLLNNCSVEIYAYYTFNLCPSRTSFNSLKVYLGHGVKLNNSLNPGLSKKDLFITTFKREFDFFNTNRDDFKALYTGTPRFESLIAESNQVKDHIVVAPGWRRWLNKKASKKDEYFVEWSNFIKSKELEGLSSKHKIIFMIHPELESRIKLFKMPKYIDSLRYSDLGAGKIQDLMKRTKLMITDYSSASIDYAIAGSELVYFQFDKDNYYVKHTAQKGWYDYEKDGFGPVFFSLKDLTNYIATEINKNNSEVNVYKKRLANFLNENHDALNCPSRNIYDEIVKVLKNNNS